ncbi:hypothetical protein [Pseudarthrobacter albicanus]|uniref:hypothetical protein n=1 Tax=Pseudarthrobacter albicanus TaxID=2823873 RepID=UPI001BA6BAC4|nr:hypothetical protein [Pseudarthrobacter albicanus]
MTGLGMIHRDGRHWKFTATANLSRIATRLGVMDDVAAHITRNRKERAAWHAWLDRHITPALATHEIYDHDAEHHWIPPTDEETETQDSGHTSDSLLLNPSNPRFL